MFCKSVNKTYFRDKRTKIKAIRKMKTIVLRLLISSEIHFLLLSAREVYMIIGELSTKSDKKNQYLLITTSTGILWDYL